MNYRPILFKGEMVRAILALKKTQTRRLVKRTALEWLDDAGFIPEFVAFHENHLSPYGYAGDRLWVRETFSAHGAFGGNGRIVYRANIPDGKEPHGLKWKPSIFMRPVESRIDLDVTALRIERLNDITEADAIAEGIEPVECGDFSGWKNYLFERAHPGPRVKVTDDKHRIQGFADPRQSYRSLWESINGAGSWAKNPWVWVPSFTLAAK